MKLSVKDSGKLLAVSLAGRLDAGSSPEVEKALAEAIAGCQGGMVMDMTSLEYISSAGLRVMLMAAKRMQQKGGKLALFGLSENVKDVFDISGFSSVFKIFSNAQEACASVEA